MKPSSTDDPFELAGLGRRDFMRLAAQGVAAAALWRVVRTEALPLVPVGSTSLPVGIGWWRDSQRLLAAGKPALSAYDPTTGASDRVLLAPIDATVDPRIVPAEQLPIGAGTFASGARVRVHGVHAAPAVARAGAIRAVGVSGMANVSGVTDPVRFLAWSLRTKHGVNHSAPVAFRTPVGKTGLRLALDGVGYTTHADCQFALTPGSAAGPKLREGIYVIAFPGRDGVAPDLSTCQMRSIAGAPRAYRLMQGTHVAPFGAVILSVTQVR